MTRGEECRDARLQALQARALEPLVEMIAESLAKGDESSLALVSWLETLDGSDALQAVRRRIVEACLRLQAEGNPKAK